MRFAAIAALGLLLTVSNSLRAESGQFPGVEKLMTAKEYREAGIDKLSDEEREALNQWLIKYTAFEATTIKKTVKEVQVVENIGTRTTLKGKFTGWNGKTLFHLNNGQVWKQRSSGRYYPPRMLVDPEVKVSKNRMGFDELEILALGAKVGVRRVK